MTRTTTTSTTQTTSITKATSITSHYNNYEESSHRSITNATNTTIHHKTTRDMLRGVGTITTHPYKQPATEDQTGAVRSSAWREVVRAGPPYTALVWRGGLGVCNKMAGDTRRRYISPRPAMSSPAAAPPSCLLHCFPTSVSLSVSLYFYRSVSLSCPFVRVNRYNDNLANKWKQMYERRVTWKTSVFMPT